MLFWEFLWVSDWTGVDPLCLGQSKIISWILSWVYLRPLCLISISWICLEECISCLTDLWSNCFRTQASFIEHKRENHKKWIKGTTWNNLIVFYKVISLIDSQQNRGEFLIFKRCFLVTEFLSKDIPRCTEFHVPNCLFINFALEKWHLKSAMYNLSLSFKQRHSCPSNCLEYSLRFAGVDCFDFKYQARTTV